MGGNGSRPVSGRVCACLVRAKETCECRGRGHSGLSVCLEEVVPEAVEESSALQSPHMLSHPVISLSKGLLASTLRVMGAGMYYPCKEETWGAVRTSVNI